MKKKADWAIKWINDEVLFWYKLHVAFYSRRYRHLGIFLFYLLAQKRGLIPGLCFSNELISRDEGLHTGLRDIMYSMLQDKPSVTEVIQIIQEAVSIEKEFIGIVVPCALIGMNETLMKQYIEYVADRYLQMLKIDPVYKTANPFEWMELVSIQGKTRQFEKSRRIFK